MRYKLFNDIFRYQASLEITVYINSTMSYKINFCIFLVIVPNESRYTLGRKGDDCNKSLIEFVSPIQSE